MDLSVSSSGRPTGGLQCESFDLTFWWFAATGAVLHSWVKWTDGTLAIMTATSTLFLSLLLSLLLLLLLSLLSLLYLPIKWSVWQTQMHKPTVLCVRCAAALSCWKMKNWCTFFTVLMYAVHYRCLYMDIAIYYITVRFIYVLLCIYD